MPSGSFDLDLVNRVTAGAVGEAGKRTFYLQMRAGSNLISVTVEKEQLRTLTERLQEVFTRVSVPPAGKLPNMALEEPIRPVWRVGFMTLTYSQEEKRFEVSLVELVEEGAEPATGHFEANLPQMQALAAPQRASLTRWPGTSPLLMARPNGCCCARDVSRPEA